MDRRRFFLLLLPILAWPTTPALAAPPCDPSLTPQRNSAIGYRRRGEGRCEGFYIAKVSAGRLRLVGLSVGDLDFAAATHRLTLRAPAVGGPVHLRATAIPAKTYYRLDGRMTPDPGGAGGVFHWPLDVVRRAGLRAADLGLYGFLVDDPTTHVPVRLPGKGGTLRLRLQADRALARVLWRHAPAPACRCGAMPNWAPVALGPAPGRRGAVSIELPGKLPAEFCLEVAAQPVSGDWLQGRWTIAVGASHGGT